MSYIVKVLRRLKRWHILILLMQALNDTLGISLELIDNLTSNENGTYLSKFSSLQKLYQDKCYEFDSLNKAYKNKCKEYDNLLNDSSSQSIKLANLTINYGKVVPITIFSVAFNLVALISLLF